MAELATVALAGDPPGHPSDQVNVDYGRTVLERAGFREGVSRLYGPGQLAGAR